MLQNLCLLLLGAQLATRPVAAARRALGDARREDGAAGPGDDDGDDAAPVRFEDRQVPFEPEELAEVVLSEDGPLDYIGDAVLIGVFQDSLKAQGEDAAPLLQDESIKQLDEAVAGVISGPITAGMFEGALGETYKLWVGGNTKEVVLVGLGLAADVATNNTGATAPATPYWLGIGDFLGALAAEFTEPAFYTAPLGEAAPPLNVKDFAYGYMTHERPSGRFNGITPVAPPVPLIVLGMREGREELAEAMAYARGTLLATYLSEAPANICNTKYMADAAEYVAGLHDSMSLKIHEEADAEGMGMNAYLAVSKGSKTPPKFIHLTYTPADPSSDNVALIGKGITFDTGGYNIKLRLMAEMKRDMSGAAAVLGAARTIGLLQPSGGPTIHFISPVCENMISGDATRPSDIVTSAAGITVEISNTDAEGRLTLIDAFWYAQEVVGVQKIVDIATLTGSAFDALGTRLAAVVGKNKAAVDQVIQAGAAFGERAWQMPLEPGYRRGAVTSSIADVANVGPGPGVTAASLFLELWVRPETEWVHVDSAGPGVVTGFGAAMLASWAQSQ